MYNALPNVTNQEDFTSNFYSFGFKVCWAARGVLDPLWHAEHEVSPHTKLYFVNSGNGYLRHNGKTLPLEGGYVYVIPSNCDVSYGCTYLDKIWVSLDIYGIDKLDLMLNYTEVKRFPFSQKEFDELYAALSAGDYTQLFKVFSIMQNVIYTYTASTPISLPIKSYSTLVTQAMKYIQNNIRISLRTDEIAAELKVSPSTLRQKFKSEQGETIGKYIDRLVFAKAQSLLADDWVSIDNISSRLGFNDRFYFSNRFKELFGVTPSQYRRNILTLPKNNQK